jgi:hypothetical protein
LQLVRRYLLQPELFLLSVPQLLMHDRSDLSIARAFPEQCLKLTNPLLIREHLLLDLPGCPGIATKEISYLAFSDHGMLALVAFTMPVIAPHGYGPA